jgi:hypothetical protein
VSVCNINCRCKRKKEENKTTDIIGFKSTGEILCPVTIDFIVSQAQSGECLCSKLEMQTNEKNREG